MKSKRNCEGYAPRVVFKDPLSAYRPTVGATNGNGIHYQNMSSQEVGGGPFARVSAGSASQAVLPPIAPRPSPPSFQNGASAAPPVDAQGVPTDQFGLFGYTFDGQTFADSDLPPRMRQDLMQQGNPYEKRRSTLGAVTVPQHRLGSLQHLKHQHVSTGEGDIGIDMGYPRIPSEWSHSSTSSAGPPMAAAQPNQTAAGISPTTDEPALQKPVDLLPRALLPSQSDRRLPEQWLNTTPDSYQNAQWASFEPHDDQQQYGSGAHVVRADEISRTTWHDIQGAAQETFGMQQPSTTSQTNRDELTGVSAGYAALDVLSNPGIYAQVSAVEDNIERYPQSLDVQQRSFLEEPEDDYWDVSSDEEVSVSNDYGSEVVPFDLGMMIAMSANQHGKSFRSLTNFLNEPNVLSSYRPTYAASPLRDPQTALIFCHFITATAPTISSSERRTVNSAAMFSGLPVPKSQQALWTYTMPLLALHHQGLLHSMLALASLHIAKLQRSSPTPSLKHYHFALRKVAKSLGNPTKRNNIATLGATLLLGFYEVTTAEHNKWNSHLVGAKQLIMDIDFVGTAKRIKAHKAQTKANRTKQPFNPYSNDFTQPYLQHHQYHDVSDDSKELDENLISIIMGWQTRYNQYGQIIDGSEHSAPPSTKPVTEKEIDDFEAQCDLFWWYAKQDMYQSIVSGNRLL